MPLTVACILMVSFCVYVFRSLCVFGIVMLVMTVICVSNLCELETTLKSITTIYDKSHKKSSILSVFLTIVFKSHYRRANSSLHSLIICSLEFFWRIKSQGFMVSKSRLEQAIESKSKIIPFLTKSFMVDLKAPILPPLR